MGVYQQELGAPRIERTYRSGSERAVLSIAEVVSIDLLAFERKQTY